MPFGISAVAISNLGIDSAVIEWGTSHPATSLVDYGESTSYGSSVTDEAMTTTHSLALTGLKPATLYHYRVSSTNAYGNVVVSDDITFTTPAFTAKTVGDFGNVTVMEVNGNYDAKNPDNTTNALPRQEIAKEYFKNHPDQDFLVLFSTFDYQLPEAGAEGFYLEVKNDTQGIGRPILDNSPAFGSAGKLQGTIDLGDITAFAAAPYGPKLEETLSILGHEFMHRFGAYVKFRNADGTTNTALLGRDSSHWSYLFDSKGSVMYGNGWADNGDGTFTSRTVSSGYSLLDLYLMGMIPKAQVPPMLLIENPAIDVSQLPQLGATVSGTAKNVTIDDIIAAEGDRVPDAAAAPKQFSFGYILLIRQGDTTSTAVSAMENLRAAFAGRLAENTLGLGSVGSVPPALNIFIESPAEGASVTRQDVTVSGVFINSTGAETGVTVNGIPATVSGNKFIINQVPLQAGNNTIAIAATDVNGLSATATRIVTAQPGHYLKIVPSSESGTAPLNITFRVEGSFSFTYPHVLCTGPVSAELLPLATPNEFALNLDTEGTYTVTARAMGPDGQEYTDSVRIVVENPAKLDALLRAKWNRLNNHLLLGETAKALSFFTSYTREKYQAVFNEVKSNLPAILSSYREFKTVSIGNLEAWYKLSTQEGDNSYVYDIVFEKEENGLWLLRSY